MMRSFVFSIVLALATIVTTVHADSRQWTLQLDLGGRRVEGTPLSWAGGRVHLMGRDGHLWEFAASEAENFQKKSSGFRPYTQGEMRGQLLRRFGRDFEVSGTGHYLVVHPPGQRQQWSNWFEKLHRSMVHYFAARRFALKKPSFPLVAIVFPNQQAFMRHAAKEGSPVGRSVLGFYQRSTNRIALFDTSGGQRDPAKWLETADTIIHESAHQTAFNIGIHNRLADTPLWVIEGIGTMFEAPGVWNSRAHPHLSDRINRGRLEGYRRNFSRNRHRGTLQALVAGDQLFAAAPDAAYAYAWALMFYLAERDTSKLSRYIKLTASRPAFEPYSKTDRLRDFTRVFGPKMPLLEQRMHRFVMSLN